MTIQPISPQSLVPQGISPDTALGSTPNTAAVGQPQVDHNADAGLFSGIVDGVRDASKALERAQQAETAFANGKGDLQEMVFERARADSLLSVVSAGASKATQALNTILNMQV